MMDEKYLNNLPPDLDKENVKTNLQEFFKNPNLLWELYKNLSLSDTDILIYLERLSHYCTAKKLYQLIPNVDKFASSTKTINSCFKWKYDDALFLYMALLPSMFSSFKELYMGKTSRKNWLNKLNDEDLQELGNITVNPNNLSKKQIITEIRNALNHTHYVPGKEELYIKNPQNADPRKHAQDFEADVPYIFLVHFILLTRLYSRKIDYYGLKIDDQKLLYDLRENESNIKYEDVKDKIHFFKGVSKEKHWNGVYEDSSDSIDMKEIARSEQAENIISKYFSNNKLNKRSLCYVAECLARPPELYMREIFMALVFNQIDWIHKYKWLNSPELTLDVYQNMKNKKWIWCYWKWWMKRNVD